MAVFNVFHFSIRQMQEGGILEKLNEKYKQPDKCAERKRVKQKSHPLTLKEVMASFIILSFGGLVSVVVFCLELLDVQRYVRIVLKRIVQ